MIFIEAAGISDIGKKRNNNEDYIRVDNALKLYVVADGMGGHLAGEVASKMVVDEIVQYLDGHKNELINQQIDSDGVLSKKAEQLLASIEHANNEVYQASINNESFRGMGATLATVYFTDETFIAANVGDSPVYVVHDKTIEIVSVPHTVRDESIALGEKNPKLPEGVFGHMLTRAVGTDETVLPDICESQFFNGDIFIICSDGLSRKVSSEEMLNLVNKKTSEQACKLFVDLANNRGGDDNISVIVLKIKKVNGIIDMILNFFSIAGNRLSNYYLKCFSSNIRTKIKKFFNFKTD